MFRRKPGRLIAAVGVVIIGALAGAFLGAGQGASPSSPGGENPSGRGFQKRPLPNDPAPEPGLSSAKGESQHQKAARADSMSQEEFGSWSDQVLKTLPSLSDIRALHEEQMHLTPQPILDAGESLGEVARILGENPELKAQGARFYSQCSLREDLPSSIRALCLADLRNLDPHSDITRRLNIPERIRALAERVPVGS